MRAIPFKSYSVICSDDDCPWGTSIPVPGYRYAVKEAQQHANDTGHVCWVDSTQHRPLRPKGGK